MQNKYIMLVHTRAAASRLISSYHLLNHSTKSSVRQWSTSKLFIFQSTSQHKYNFPPFKSYSISTPPSATENQTSAECSSVENVITSPCQRVVIPSSSGISLPDFVWEQSVKHHATKTALIDGISGNSYTYKEASDESKKFGMALHCHMNLKRGDVIAFFMPNCPEYITSLLGTIGIGGVVTTINPNYTANEVY